MAEKTSTVVRKEAHLDLCAGADVEPQGNDTLLGQAHLIHCALPELALSDVDLSVTLFGKRLHYPLLVTGMTGGTARAGSINRDLASLAQEFGLAFGVGSQRAMSEDASRTDTFRVREVAPTAVLLGNIGMAEAARVGCDGVRRLADGIDADGLAVHLNVAQELGQVEGDRDFRGGYALIESLAAAFADRLVVKETGCGLSPQVARRLVDCGVKALDVSGLGGTSWIRVEQLRSAPEAASLAQSFDGWGIPTAAAVASVHRAIGDDAMLIASGGIRSGVEIAKCLALGASMAGMALPLFRAQQQGGLPLARQTLEGVLAGLRQAALLTGARDVAALRANRVVVTGALASWLEVL
ncbi:MAG TPA: type 2 isopentenyl-diphosphate Delta-isomerase [Candidatus Binatia bacterium]|nr:type 2 isopentenyl-diphosphate Delta-isomerase [Candidatus Binatia bacterium]